MVTMADCVDGEATSGDTASPIAKSGVSGRLEPEPEAVPSSSCVCRDFLRNVCRRGDRCRFLHPVDPTSARRDVIAASHHRPLVFCHDFQNAAGCKRGTSCRFAHCTRDEEATYQRTGLLPIHVHRKLSLDVAISKALLRGETPVCLDFIKAGGCRRANGKCRYRHVTAAEFEREQITVNDHQMSLRRCAGESDVYSGHPGTTSANGLVYRKRKLTSDDSICDDVMLCGSKFGCAGNVFDPMTPSNCTMGQLIAVLEPVNNVLSNRWNASTINDLQGMPTQFCVGRPCRLVAVPTAANIGFGSTAMQSSIRFASSPPGVAMVAQTPSSAPVRLLTVLQPYV